MRQIRINENKLHKIIKENIDNVITQQIVDKLLSLGAVETTNNKRTADDLSPQTIKMIENNEEIYKWVIGFNNRDFCSKQDFKSMYNAESACNKILKEINFKEIYKKDRRAYAQVEVYFVETFDYDFDNIPAGYTSIESDTCLVYSPKDDMWMD